MRNNLASILLEEPFQVKQVIGKIHPNQLRQVLVFATRSKNWKLRRNSIELLGTVASTNRMNKDNERHFQVLQSFRNLPGTLMKLATRDKNEAVQSSAAWALGQVNDWPEIFNERVLRPTRVAGHVGIDTSLPFLPPGGDSGCVRPREAIKLAKQFIPHFDGHGFEMRWDTRDLYLGPYYRVLKDPESPQKGRCIEYFFMWSRQNWPISLFFSSYFWPLLSLLALFQLEANLHSPLDGWQALVGVGVILVAYGLGRTLHPTRCFKSDSWYAVGGALFVGSLWWNHWVAPYVPALAAAVIFIISKAILSRKPEHFMDYEPVYLYLEKGEKSRWVVREVRYDSFHYDVAKRRKLSKHMDGDTVFIKTDNMWRSFELDTPHHFLWDSFYWYWGSVVLWVGYYALAVILLWPGFIVGHYLERMLIGISAPFVLMGLNWKATTPISAPFLDKKPPSIPEKLYEQPDKRVLTYCKLAHLWNVVDDKAKLIIRRKVQDPFRVWRDRSYWNTFHDPSAERLAYEALKKIESFRRTKR